MKFEIQRMKTIIALLTAALIFPITAGAQTDKKAKAILDEVSIKTKSFKTIRIDFTYQMENKAQKINDSFKGTIISKGDSYKLTFSGQEVISNGKTVWTFLKDANEVQINNVSHDEESFSPTSLLNNYSENFRPKLIEENAKNQIIELTPIQKKNFNKVRITIEKSKKMLSSISIYDKNGSVYTYTVNKFETDIPFKDSMFSFRAEEHPGVDEIDMR